MFKNTFQSGLLSVLYSIGSKPLQIWDKQVRNGHIKRITDNDIQSLVIEIMGNNVRQVNFTRCHMYSRPITIKVIVIVTLFIARLLLLALQIQRKRWESNCHF